MNRLYRLTDRGRLVVAVLATLACAGVWSVCSWLLFPGGA